MAFSGIEQPELRITFDTNLRFRTDELDLRLGSHGAPLLMPDEVLMELKIPGVCPMWLSFCPNPAHSRHRFRKSAIAIKTASSGRLQRMIRRDPTVLESIISSQLTLSAFLICTFTSIVLGVGIALVGMYRSRSSQSYAVALAILPVVVQLVIMLVNGNVGAGVAVAGAFSLVRFRSVPGTAREIGVLFMAMAVGLATGMGYVGLAVISFVIISAVIMALTALNFGKGKAEERTLKITIPENLDYEGLFDDVFAEYTRSNSLVKVKTSNMGTLYELEYRIVLNGDNVPKDFLDALRCRNGNLNITCGRESTKEVL